KLRANDFAKAREIVAWKENVAAAWDGIKVLSVNAPEATSGNFTGEMHDTTIVIDTNGLGRNIGVECVAYKIENGEEKLWDVLDLKVVKEEGSVLTYELRHKYVDPGVFHYAYRIYPKNEALPHRQDFAWVRWI
ncbi:MAG: DUF3417 domain-containing protein, partial [Muribaculaceae bacterium]|nr:DUF3417 domain-containing protein [Muribaculaceae bacterium]